MISNSKHQTNKTAIIFFTDSPEHAELHGGGPVVLPHGVPQPLRKHADDAIQAAVRESDARPGGRPHQSR